MALVPMSEIDQTNTEQTTRPIGEDTVEPFGD